MKKFTPIPLLSIAFLFIALMIVSCNKKDTDPLGAHDIDDDRELPFENPDWMAGLHDNLYLPEITIPGTHDSGADLHTSAQGAESNATICQDFRFSNQLMLGIRCFDVRLDLGDGGDLNFFHGPYYLHKSFNDLIDPTIEFLTNHPKEFVIFIIKQEHSSAGHIEFGNAVYGYLNDKGLDHFCFINESVPTVGELRGRILIIRRFDFTDGVPYGLHFDWSNNTSGSSSTTDLVSLYAQDHYAYLGKSTDDKIAEIKDCIHRSVNEYDWRKFYINFTSCEKDLENLEHISDDINPVIKHYLKDNSDFRQCGIIMVNFAGGTDDGDISPGLVPAIIACNDLEAENEYQFGSQVWTCHNLNYSHDIIDEQLFMGQDPNVFNLCGINGIACYSYPGWNDLNHETNGNLYNWHAVNKTKVILAHSGWHIPTVNDWETLIQHYGGSSVAGGALKYGYPAGVFWQQPNTGASSQHFVAVGTGYIDSTGVFMEALNQCYFWTSTEIDATHAWAYRLDYNSAAITKVAMNKACGCSVRLIKD